MILPDKVYNVMKWIVTLVLPAIGTFVGTVGTALNWELTGLVVTIILALATMIGTMIGVSTANYTKTK